jgi:hypothetical protein
LQRTSAESLQRKFARHKDMPDLENFHSDL